MDGQNQSWITSTGQINTPINNHQGYSENRRQCQGSQNNHQQRGCTRRWKTKKGLQIPSRFHGCHRNT